MPRSLVAPAVLLFVAATFAVGLVLDARGERLGTPLPPLAFGVDAQVSLPWLALAVLVLAGAVALVPPLAALSPARFAAALLVLGLVVRLAVGALRFGPEGWDDPFNESFEAKNEYLPALPAIDALGVRFFLDRFDALAGALPVHTAGHPPGLVLTLHWLGLDTPQAAAALVIAVGALAVPATYWIARSLLADEERARVAGVLSAFACATTLYGVTSADVLFAALGALAAVLLLRNAVAGAVALSVASFFSYAVLAVGAWVVLTLRSVRIALLCAVAFAAFWLALYALTGFELWDVIPAVEGVYRESVARVRPYAFWLFGSPAAFLAFLGLPITWYFARALGAGERTAVALAIVIVISAVAGFTKAETERIWLMYVPLACVAAASVLPRRRIPVVLGLLCVQSVAVELVFGTVW